MPLKRHVSSTLRPFATRAVPSARAHPSCPAHRYSTYPERIAVLGGGIAGLSTAYFVSREFPNSKITLFEAKKETGGWIKSKRVGVPGGDVVFELGPRTLRNSVVTAHLCQELDLIKDMTFTYRSDPAARNRYIYYPDRLNRLPANGPSFTEFISLWRSGIIAGAFGILKEPMQSRRPADLTDESIGSFLARRVDKRIANNIVSAVFHGIYAGNIWNLSAKTHLRLAWELEGKYGSALGGFLRMQNENTESQRMTLAHPYDIEAASAMKDEIHLEDGFRQQLDAASTFTFKNGLQQLYEALAKAVEKTGNVEIKTETPVKCTSARQEEEGVVVEVTAGEADSQTTTDFNLAISTLRYPLLTDFVTVQTVNLFYSTPNLNPPGFGYLIPQSIPFDQNPERALGVIFDSSAIHGQDSVQGTKLTVMMGGHWWKDWKDYPDNSEGLEMAKSVVARHLNIREEPIAAHVNLSSDCIPQYTVGYQDRLLSFAQTISSQFKGRLRVVGNQFNGVGVNDVITGAWHMARTLRGEGWKSSNVGLERVRDKREWQIVPVGELKYQRDGSR